MLNRLYITIVLCILVSLPFIIYQNKLSVLGTPANFMSKKDEKKSYFSTLVFSALILLHTPVIYVRMAANGAIDKILFIAYYVFAFILLYMDPGNLIMNPIYPTEYYFVFLLAIVFVLLFTPVNLYVLLIFLYGICISWTALMMRRSKETRVYYKFGYSFYAIAYLFLLKPDILQGIMDGLEETKEEDKTPPIQITMYVYLSVLFFLLVFTLPKLIRIYHGGVPFINTPVLLDTKKTFKVEPSYPYALSFWINMEAVPPEFNAAASAYTNVVSCGENVKCQYNNSLNKLRVMFMAKQKNGQEQAMFIEKNISPQRWNHVVISNDGASIDVYLNGELTNTISAISNTSGELVVGQDKGIAGQLCNLQYYTTTMTYLSVQQLYQQFSPLDPPIY
jgi:hypothetical protein